MNRTPELVFNKVSLLIWKSLNKVTWSILNIAARGVEWTPQPMRDKIFHMESNNRIELKNNPQLKPQLMLRHYCNQCWSKYPKQCWMYFYHIWTSVRMLPQIPASLKELDLARRPGGSPTFFVIHQPVQNRYNIPFFFGGGATPTNISSLLNRLENPEIERVFFLHSSPPNGLIPPTW